MTCSWQVGERRVVLLILWYCQSITSRPSVYSEKTMLHAWYSFPLFLSSPFLTYCAIIPTSFRGRGPHLRRRLVAQPSSTVSKLRFSRIFIDCKVNARRPVRSRRYHHIVTLIINWQTCLTWNSGQVDFGYVSGQKLEPFGQRPRFHGHQGYIEVKEKPNQTGIIELSFSA